MDYKQYNLEELQGMFDKELISPQAHGGIVAFQG